MAVTGIGGIVVEGTGVATSEEIEVDPEVILPAPGGSVTPPEPPLPPTPPDYAPEPLRHVWQRLAAPVLGPDGIDPDWMPTHEGNSPYGRMQIVVEGTDITYWGGAATPEPDWMETEPFGWGPATLRLPQVTVYQPMPSWARNGANVLVRMRKVSDNSWVTLYEGVVTRVNDRQDSGLLSLECTGTLYVANLQFRKPAFSSAPLDIGTVIARTLNEVISRRYLRTSPVTTGIRTSVLGGWEPTLTGYLSNILATAIDKGKQWTVRLINRRPVIGLKDTTTVAWTVRAGQPGVTIDLGEDGAEAIGAVYGWGINPDGGRWRNDKYPNWKPDDTPPYPFNDPNRTIRVGDTDADTDTGDGISVFQAKAGMSVTGRFSQSNKAATERLQRNGGIQVDGIPGPQTWALVFDTGANTGTLDGAWTMPLAYATEVMPRLYGPDGDDLGPNPNYDPDVLRVERTINYGQGVKRSEGARNAREVLARDSDPGLVGTVTFDKMDPESMHRYELRAGQNGLILGWRGQDVKVHSASVRKSGQQVSLNVDTKGRDHLELRAIMERDKNAQDPARLARERLLHGRITPDRAIYDADSPGGILPRHPLFQNLWNVRRIPLGDYGRVVRSEFRTTGPASPFSVAVFGKPITAAQLLSIVGNPLAAETNPWSEHAEALDKRGLLQAWGWAKQPAGYWPREYSNPDGESGAPVTGRMKVDASWEYATSSAPWVWVASIASLSCRIEGRLYGAPSD